MEQFIVSARKYRPDSFDTLIGQDTISATLKNSIRRGQLAHAYLFCGPRGVGKTTTARIFAKSINCLNPGPDMDPCGECESCRSFSEGRSYCIHELDAASNNSVDDIRNLTDMVRIPPQVGKYSVFIIDEVHMLSSAAFNAFLKTLEEPPSYAIFILATTEKHKVLPTVMSRCQTYDFNRISIPDIISNLRGIASREGVTADDETYHILAMKADGSMRDALTLFDQSVAFCGKEISSAQVKKNLNVLDQDYYFRIIDNSLKKDYIESMKILDEVLSKGFNALHFVSGLSSHIRDLMVCRSGAADALLELPDTMKEHYREQAQRCSVRFLYQALSVTVSCEAGYRQSGNQRLLIEFALMKLALWDTAPSAGAGQRQQTDTSSGAGSGPVSSTRTEPVSAAPRAGKPSAASLPSVRPAPESGTVPNGPGGVNKASAIVSDESAQVKKASGPGISLKDMLRSVSVEKGESPGEKLPDVPYTEEKFMEVWMKIAAERRESGKAGMAAAMEKYHPLVDIPNNHITFYLSNDRQVASMKAGAELRMQETLRRRLSNSSLILSSELYPELAGDEKTRLPYTDTEKTSWLLSRSEGFRELHKALELDVK